MNPPWHCHESLGAGRGHPATLPVLTGWRAPGCACGWGRGTTWLLDNDLATAWTSPRAEAHGMAKRGILHPPDLCHPAQVGLVSPATGLSPLLATPAGYVAVGEWAQPSAASERHKCLRRWHRGDSNAIFDSLRRGLARKIPLQRWQRAWRGTGSAHRHIRRASALCRSRGIGPLAPSLLENFWMVLNKQCIHPKGSPSTHSPPLQEQSGKDTSQSPVSCPGWRGWVPAGARAGRSRVAGPRDGWWELCLSREHLCRLSTGQRGHLACPPPRPVLPL